MVALVHPDDRDMTMQTVTSIVAAGGGHDP
jgi:hypothetical protein